MFNFRIPKSFWKWWKTAVCYGNCNKPNKIRVFCLPQEQNDRERWLMVIAKRCCLLKVFSMKPWLLREKYDLKICHQYLIICHEVYYYLVPNFCFYVKWAKWIVGTISTKDNKINSFENLCHNIYWSTRSSVGCYIEKSVVHPVLTFVTGRIPISFIKIFEKIVIWMLPFPVYIQRFFLFQKSNMNSFSTGIIENVAIWINC